MKKSGLVLIAFASLLIGAGCVQQASVDTNTLTQAPAPITAPITAPIAEEPKTPAPEPKDSAPAAPEARQPVVNVTPSGEAWLVIADGKKIAEIPWPVDSDGPSAELVAQSSSAVYVSVCPGGLGGAYVYAACPIGLIQVDLATGQKKDLSTKGVLQDVSVAGMLVAWKNDSAKKLIVKSLTDGSEQRVISVSGVTAFGDAHFSPDGKKIAYATFLGDSNAFFGIPGGAYSSQVIMIDLASGNRTVIAEKKNAAFSVTGWKDASTVEYRQQ